MWRRLAISLCEDDSNNWRRLVRLVSPVIPAKDYKITTGIHSIVPTPHTSDKDSNAHISGLLPKLFILSRANRDGLSRFKWSWAVTKFAPSL